MQAPVLEKLTGLRRMWAELESTTQTKAQCLFDANKAELFTQSCADLDQWLGSLEDRIQSDDFGKDLTSVNILLKKQQVLYRYRYAAAAATDRPRLPCRCWRNRWRCANAKWWSCRLTSRHSVGSGRTPTRRTHGGSSWRGSFKSCWSPCAAARISWRHLEKSINSTATWKTRS